MAQPSPAGSEVAVLIAVVNSKGGVGKSTLSIHAAVWLQETGLRVAVIDADAQGSLSHWLKRFTNEIPIFPLRSVDEILTRAPQLVREFDVVLADGPAAFGNETGALVASADLALMPLNPSAVDIYASYRTARLIYKMRFNPKRRGLPRAYTILNRVQPRTRVARIATSAIQKYGFPVACTAIQHRSAYAMAATKGTVVWHMGAAARDAAEEMQRLFREILDLSTLRQASQPAAYIAGVPGADVNAAEAAPRPAAPHPQTADT